MVRSEGCREGCGDTPRQAGGRAIPIGCPDSGERPSWTKRGSNGCTRKRRRNVNQINDDQSTGIADVKQLGTFAAIGSLGYVFWVVGGMEMIERLAYYGVKAVAVLYVTDSASSGGLGTTMTDYSRIIGTWALFQSVVPIFTGGLSDRYGYKETIFASTVVKIIGYLIMAFFPTYAGFFVGALVLATGTAIFKPGIQGTLVKTTSRKNSSLAWGIFYQTVNIGGFLGPLAVQRKVTLQA